jgi:D-alanyl-D-alanine carboxypeptidase (penicillin-binding protein 5/6)
MELIAVVMGAESSQERFAGCKQLLDYGFSNYALITPEASVQCVPVRLGKEKTVRAILAQSGALLIDKSQKAMVKTQIELLDVVEAPVGEGQRLGTLTLKAGEQILSQIPLIAEKGVGRVTWAEIFWQIIQKIAFKNVQTDGEI